MAEELNFEGLEGRLPPQNIEAEESILGGILLDPEAISRIAELLLPDAFYISSHTTIYHTMLFLHGQGLPTDLISVASRLSDLGQLAAIGGQAKLVQLVDRTVSAVNIDRYAALVMDKYLRRQLIQAGREIDAMGYDTATDLEVVLDRAEQKVFNVTQKRPQQDLVPIYETLVGTFEDIEAKHESQAQPGILTDFYDFDAMTGGLQPSDLIIVAGRPSMGKCLHETAQILQADGRLVSIGELYRQQHADLLTLGDDWKLHRTQPSQFIDDGIKPVFRVTTQLGRQVETTLTHPFLTIDGWRPLSELQLGDRVAVPRVLPVFGSRSMPEHEIKLLAYFIGDGTVTADVPRFTNSNPVVQAEFTDAIHHFPGLSVRCDTSNGQRTPTFYVVGDQDFVYSQRQTFAAELNQALEVSPLPAYAIAEKIGVTPSLISQWRHGVCVPSRQVEEKLNHIFDLESICISVDIDTVRREHWNVIKDWLKTHQLWGKNAHQKSIPSCIFQLPKSQLSLFINRLFTTDGWASVLQSGQVQLGYTSVNRELVSQLQHLLLRFGIIGSIKERNIRYKGERRQAWQLDITHAESICIFLEEIGIFGKEGSVNLAKQSIQARRRQSNRDLIPLELWSKLKTLKGNESWSSLAKRAGIKGYSNIHAGKRDFSRSRLFCLAQALGNQNLINIATSDVYWDAVINIEYIGDHQVYDLTIPKTHNFIANDICVHNTAVSLNIAQNIAKTYRLPIAIFSLEMSKEQLVQRLLSSEAGIEANRLRAGRVSQNEWEPFNNALTSLSEMPIFIDDTPNIVVSEIRSKCRRLQAEQGQNLGLVLLDYLQLMEGGGDNRVQELSRITRSLKGLARELNVPVIALSQLSRGVEARTNKRPMMSDLRESGCLAGDTLVTLTSGERVPIRDLVDRENVQVWALDEQDLKLKPASVSHAFLTGIKLIYRLTTRLGRTIDATANHKFRVLDGWVRLDELHVDSRIALPRSITNTTQQDILSPEELAFLGHLIGDGCTLPRRSIQYTTKEFELAAIVQDLAIAIFGSSINPRIVKERSWYQVYFPASERLTHGVRNPITAWLDNLGIFGLRSYEKKLPRILFQQSNDAISKFLRHLWCTDGCLNLIRGRSIRPVAYYATSSITLATDVQSLLLRLGIIARLKLISQGNKGRDHYHVTITGKQDIEIFLERVATVGIRRTQTANEIRDHLKSKVANTNRDVIPRDIWSDLVLPVLEASSFTHRQFQTTLGQSYCGSTLYRQNLSRERALKIANVLNCSSLKLLSESDIYWDEIASIEPIGETDVYDLTVPGFHNFVANDIVVHNSIEQDADLIVMLYRDEYYNPDTPDRGITEMIIAKHRNGPTGIVKLLFESQYTRFRNMAGGFQAGSLNPNQPGQLPPM